MLSSLFSFVDLQVLAHIPWASEPAGKMQSFRHSKSSDARFVVPDKTAYLTESGDRHGLTIDIDVTIDHLGPGWLFS